MKFAEWGIVEIDVDNLLEGIDNVKGKGRITEDIQNNDNVFENDGNNLHDKQQADLGIIHKHDAIKTLYEVFKFAYQEISEIQPKKLPKST